jgi:hypothetical protein
LPNPDEAGALPRSILYSALKRALVRPDADRAVVIVALVLLAFSLDTGLSADDYIHELIAQGSTQIKGFIRAPLDMYRFTSGEHTPELMREGILEWWADPEAKLAFLRPVAALTHYVDYRLWPSQPWLMHLHSLLWAALLLTGLLQLYRKLITPRWVCALSMFIYALDDARGWFVSWVAARNAVVATAFSIWALWFYHRARSEGYKPGILLSLLLFTLSLFSNEGAVSILGYMLAHALFLEHGPLPRRLLGLSPHVAVLLAWRIAYRILGYGVAHSGLYFDPFNDTTRFLAALLERAPILLFSQVGGPWSDAFSVMFAFPALQRMLMLVAALVLLTLGYVLWPIFRRDPLARFGAAGALLSLLPASATFLADRLLSWVAIGASIVLARLIAVYIDEREVLNATALRALVLPPLMLYLVLSKTIVDPVCLPWRARGNRVVRDSLDRAFASIPSSPSIRGKRVVYINPVAVPQAAYLPIERAGRGVPRPAAQCLLATAEAELRVERIDTRSLRVRQRGGFLQSPGSRLFRNPERRFERGARINLDWFEIEVTDLTVDGRPAEIIARFDRPLEDSSFLWRRWDGAGQAPFVPPAIGQSVNLPAADIVRAIIGDSIRLPVDGRLPPAPDPAWDPAP